MVQRTAQKSFHLLIEALADLAKFRFGNAAVGLQGLHQIIHVAGGDAAGVGLHHHSVERLVDPAAGLQPASRVRSCHGAALGWPG